MWAVLQAGILLRRMRLLNTILFCLISILITSQHLAWSVASLEGVVSLEELFISSIKFERLDRVTEQRVQNLIQSAVGELYDPERVEGDVHTLTHLGVFENITAKVVLQEDDTLELIFTFTEQQIITQVSVVGNTQIGDKELLASTPVMEGLGLDQDAIDRGKRAIMDVYKAQGNYLVEVIPETIVYGKDSFTEEDGEQRKIPETVVLIYRIMEGPRVRVKGMLFYGTSISAWPAVWDTPPVCARHGLLS